MTSSTYEYAIVVVGGTNGRPWGAKADGFLQAPHLERDDLGVDLTSVVIEAGENTGSGKVLTVGTTLTANKWVGAQLRIGTTAVPLGGYATVTANTATTITVTWVQDAASNGTFAGYLVRADSTLDDPWPSVRVLTPYQPEYDAVYAEVPYPAANPGPTADVPGYSIPSTVTSYEDVALFLPFSFREGIASHGVCELTDSYSSPTVHECASAGSGPPGTLVIAATGGGNNLVANAFAGGYLTIQHGGGWSWQRIATNTNDTFTLSGAWLGAGLPTGTPSAWEFTAWVPHYDNSPHAYLPGTGFRYPNNDMQPSSEGDGRIRNLPRGVTSTSYGDRFGFHLELGWRLAAALGVRINLIHLEVNEATLALQNTVNLEGYAGSLGWWDYRKHHDFNPANANGVAARLEKMVTEQAATALAAESNTKPLRILGVVMAFGEDDAELPGGRENYQRSLNDFADWVRDLIEDAGYSPYSLPARVPVVHPLITEDPWEDDDKDSEGYVNAAVREVMESLTFAEVVDTTSSAKDSDSDENFNGQGEAENGALYATVLGGLIDDALAYGSEVLDTADPAVDICNLALSFIGETAAVTSLDTTVDTSRQAKLCAQFYPTARDTLLSSHNWGFAMKRKAAVLSTNPPTQYDYAYVVPGEAVRVVAVLPDGSTNDFSDPWVGWDRTVWESEITGGSGSYTPRPFIIERAAGGHRLIMTDTEDAWIRYLVRVVDPDRFSPPFRLALSWHLASMLAGPILKGRPGAQLAAYCQEQARQALARATTEDSNERRAEVTHIVPWIQSR